MKNNLKKIIKKLILNKTFARLLINPVLKIHSLSYVLADLFSITLEGGTHPKHRIIKYEEWFLEQIDAGWVILDIGSNTGIMSWLLAEKAGFIYGIEIEDELFKEAESKRKKSNIKYICADARKFNFNRCKAIDCIVLSNVLEHINDRVHFLKKLTSDINWRNRNRKRLLFRVPMINRDWIVLYKKERGLNFYSDKTHLTEYTFEEFEKELLQADIKILNYVIKFGEIYAVADAK